MPREDESAIAARMRRLAEFLTASDAVRVRIERDGEELEVGRAPGPAPLDSALASDGAASVSEPAPRRLDAIKADLVGVFRLSRPAPVEGELLEGDRELAYVEALGIRNPVHSLGAGRIVTIAAGDGQPVEYGQALFYVDRG